MKLVRIPIARHLPTGIGDRIWVGTQIMVVEGHGPDYLLARPLGLLERAHQWLLDRYMRIVWWWM